MPASSALLLADLARQLVELLSDGEVTGSAEVDPLEDLVEMDSPRSVPADPALQRLLPDGYRDDSEQAAEFRRFTEAGLRRSKIEAAEALIDSIGEVEPDGDDPTIDFELSPEQARAWMRCLTDLRLTLASRLEITGYDDEEDWLALPDEDPRGPLYRIYGWLGYQLETLIDAAH